MAQVEVKYVRWVRLRLRCDPKIMDTKYICLSTVNIYHKNIYIYILNHAHIISWPKEESLSSILTVTSCYDLSAALYILVFKCNGIIKYHQTLHNNWPECTKILNIWAYMIILFRFKKNVLLKVYHVGFPGLIQPNPNAWKYKCCS